MPTINDILDMFVEFNMLKVVIYSLDLSKEVYAGNANEIPDELLDETVQSIDNPSRYNEITLNI